MKTLTYGGNCLVILDNFELRELGQARLSDVDRCVLVVGAWHVFEHAVFERSRCASHVKPKPSTTPATSASTTTTQSLEVWTKGCGSVVTLAAPFFACVAPFYMSATLSCSKPDLPASMSQSRSISAGIARLSHLISSVV